MFTHQFCITHISPVVVVLPVHQWVVGSLLCETIVYWTQLFGKKGEKILPAIQLCSVHYTFDLSLSVAQQSVMVVTSGLWDRKNWTLETMFKLV